MATLSVKTPAGADAGTVELAPDVFGVQPNVPVMHQVVTAQLAARRAGTQSTKTRSEVAGGGGKPYRQKGTGNARQGSIRSPQFSGGGIALGPKPRSYHQRTNKKMIKLALRSALSDRANEGKVVVVEDWGFDAPRTKLAKQALDALGLAGRVLVVLTRDDHDAHLSFRNLPNVQTIDAGELNAYDVLCSDVVVFTSATLPTSDPARAVAEDEAAAPAPAAARPTPAPAATDADSDEPEAALDVEAAPAAEPEADDAAEADADDAAEADAGEMGKVDVDAEPTADAESAAGPYGPDSHAPLDDGSEPEGFPVKGNADSMLYHEPGSRSYKQTKAEVWFASADAAEAAGFAKAGSKKAEDDS